MRRPQDGRACQASNDCPEMTTIKADFFSSATADGGDMQDVFVSHEERLI